MRMKMRIKLAASLLTVLFLAGCSSRQQNPQELKEKTAEATAALKSDAKAVAEGVREGWSRDKPLDLNHATKSQLRDLPGITADDADRIMAPAPLRRSRPVSDAARHLQERI